MRSRTGPPLNTKDSVHMRKLLPIVGALVVLPGILPAQTSLADALARYRENNLEEALALFSEAAREAPENADVHAWLAETARRRRLYDASHDAANAALALTPCHAFAHTVLGYLYQPIYGGWERTSADSSWYHLRQAVECDAADGNAWIALWIEALRRGERTWENRALEQLIRTEFMPHAVLAYNRWVLGSLPPGAVLLTNGDWDTFPALGLQVADGVRDDIAVINLSMLHLPWYARLMAERHGLPLSLTDDEMDALEGKPWALPDTVTHEWRRHMLAGDLARPVTAGATVMRERLADSSGVFQLAGPYFDLVPDSAAADTASMRRALSEITISDFAGPEVSPRDRSAVRISAAVHRGMATSVLHIAVRYAFALIGAERLPEADEMIEWSERFVTETGLGSEQREMVEELKRTAARGGG